MNLPAWLKVLPEPIHQPVPDDISVEEPVNPIFDMMKEGESTLVKEHPPENPGQMPILLENHAPETRYIVGSQLNAGDLVMPTKEPGQANIEKIIPESDDSEPDDDDNFNDKSDTNKYHDAFQSFLSKSKEEETESEIEEDPMERRRRTRQTDDEVITYDPVEEEMKEKETKGNK